MFKYTQRPCKWTVTVHICTVTVACAHNILIIFFLSYLYLTLTSLSFSHFIKDSLRCTALSFSHLINLSSSSFRRSPSPPLSLSSSFFFCFSLFSGWMRLISGFRVEWGWMSLAVATACLCFSLLHSGRSKVSILLL